MNFNQVVNQLELGLTNLVIPSSWCQGRTAFGGISAALLYQACRKQVCDSRYLLSINCNFIGPLNADEGFEIQVETLREGKNATQMMARIVQNDATQVMAQICFGKYKESTLTLDNTGEFSLLPPNSKQVIPYVEHITPAFFQHVEISLQQGGMPFSKAPTSHLAGWMRFYEQATPMSELELLALSDAWPPTMLQMYPKPAPASTMSWYVEFLAPVQLAVDEWFGFEAITHSCQNGYAQEEAKIWHPNGKLLAISRQTVAVFV